MEETTLPVEETTAPVEQTEVAAPTEAPAEEGSSSEAAPAEGEAQA